MSEKVLTMPSSERPVPVRPTCPACGEHYVDLILSPDPERLPHLYCLHCASTFDIRQLAYFFRDCCRVSLDYLQGVKP